MQKGGDFDIFNVLGEYIISHEKVDMYSKKRASAKPEWVNGGNRTLLNFELRQNFSGY